MTILVLGDQRVTKNGLIRALMVNIKYPIFLRSWHIYLTCLKSINQSSTKVLVAPPNFFIKIPTFWPLGPRKRGSRGSQNLGPNFFMLPEP